MKRKETIFTIPTCPACYCSDRTVHQYFVTWACRRCRIRFRTQRTYINGGPFTAGDERREVEFWPMWDQGRTVIDDA